MADNRSGNTAGNTPTRKRVVTQPQSVQPEEAGYAYLERRNRFNSARTNRSEAQAAPTNRTPRRRSQAGMSSTSGKIQAVKRSYHASASVSPVPVRSGRLRPRRGGLLWRVLGVFALLVIVVVGANFALTNTAFRVAQVSVVGTHNALLIQSIQHMGIQGQNIFLLDVAALTARIDLVPIVASANLEKQWPNQLLVTINERTPVLLWQTREGTYSVDTNGVVIAPVSETMGADSLMTVLDMRSRMQSIHPGTHLNSADITFALAVFERLPKVVGITDFTLRYDDAVPATLAKGQASLTQYGLYGSYVVVSKTGWVAYLGGPQNANPLDNRLMELQQILTMAQQEQLNLVTIDLRFGLRPVYTLKS